jgi:hypothetical protein
VKPAASTDYQPKGARKSRAHHVRAKAKDSAERPEDALELPGVQGTARSEGAKLHEIIGQLNPVLRGLGNYFRTGNADEKFNQVDHYVHHRRCDWLRRRGGQRTSFRHDKWPFERFFGMGLHRLMGTVCYPAQAAPLRPSVSRVRENRTHGLTGDSVSPTSK